MSQYPWTTQAIQGGLATAETRADIVMYIAFVLSIPVYFAARKYLCGEHPPTQNMEPLYTLPIILADSAYFVAHAIASTGLWCTIPSTNVQFPILEPVIPNICTPELHHLEPNAWPCVREGALRYLNILVSRNGWQRISDPDVHYFMYFLAYLGCWLGLAGAHYLERFGQRLTRVYRLDDDVVGVEGEDEHQGEDASEESTVNSISHRLERLEIDGTDIASRLHEGLVVEFSQ